jgi:myo-inositol 2-dehydrogenase/D-chiro-inositol 1-dehydrogenase
MNRSKVLRMGVIGAGRIGKLHMQNLAMRISQVEVATIMDVKLEAAQELADKYHIANATTDHRKIMEDASIHAVAIFSSTDTHADLMIAAAAAGKHIFCEKPIDLTLGKIDKAIAAVNKAGVKCQIGFNKRFDPGYKKMQKAIKAGKIGDLQILRITSRDPAPPPVDFIKRSGGLFLDMTIHDFDMVRYLSSSDIVEVYALGGVMVDPVIGEAGDIDTAIITLKLASGAIATIDNSRQAVYGYDQRVEAFGSGGMITIANNPANATIYSSATGVVMENPTYFFLERYLDSYAAEMSEFVKAIMNGKPVPVTPEDSRKPVVIAMAANRSLREGRPVKISEISK